MTYADPHRRSLGSYPVTRKISVRVGDLDGHGHANAIRFGQYYEDARAAFYGTAFGRVERPSMLVAQMTVRYLGEAFWPGAVVVGTGISRIGNSSLKMAQCLFLDGRYIGLCETAIGNIAQGMKSSPLAEDIRGHIEAMRLLPPP